MEIMETQVTQSAAVSTQSDQIDQLCLALAKAQGEFENPKKNKENPYFKSKYADLSAVIDACRKILAKNDLSFVQTTEQLNDGKLVLVTRLMHKSGQWIKSFTPIPGYSKPQELGSSITYLRRYSLVSILGISADDDDDGNSAKSYDDESNTTPINKKQAQELDLLLNGNHDLRKKMLNWCGVDHISKIPTCYFNRCKAAVLHHIQEADKEKRQSA